MFQMFFAVLKAFYAAKNAEISLRGFELLIWHNYCTLVMQIIMRTELLQLEFNLKRYDTRKTTI